MTVMMPRSSTHLLGQLCLCQCLNVLKSGKTAWIWATTEQGTQTCVWKARQFQKVKKSNFKQSQHKRSLEVRLVSFFLSGITMLEENIYCSRVLKKCLKSFCAFIKKNCIENTFKCNCELLFFLSNVALSGSCGCVHHLLCPILS